MTISLLLASTDAAAGAAQSAQHTSSPSALPVALSCVSICIAIAAFTVAYRNFRLSRFPHARFFPKVSSNDEGTYFEVEIESWGLPIWDAVLYLEGQYEQGEGPGRLQMQFRPNGAIPQPMNAGQVGKWKLEASTIDSGGMTPGWRKLGFSDLPHARVNVVLYGSGEREVARLKSKDFPNYFSAFDTLNKNPTPRKPTKSERREWKETLNQNPNLKRSLAYDARVVRANKCSALAAKYRIKLPPALVKLYVGNELSRDMTVHSKSVFRRKWRSKHE